MFFFFSSLPLVLVAVRGRRGSGGGRPCFPGGLLDVPVPVPAAISRPLRLRRGPGDRLGVKRSKSRRTNGRVGRDLVSIGVCNLLASDRCRQTDSTHKNNSSAPRAVRMHGWRTNREPTMERTRTRSVCLPSIRLELFGYSVCGSNIRRTAPQPACCWQPAAVQFYLYFCRQKTRRRQRTS